MTRRVLYHPLWVHLPALGLLGVMAWAFARTYPWQARIPLQWGIDGQVSRWGSPWELVLIIGIVTLTMLGMGVLADELWVRQEAGKRFNWLTGFDEGILAWLTAMLVSTMPQLRNAEPMFRLRWDVLALCLVGAVGSAYLLELLRPYRPAPPLYVPEEPALSAEEVAAKLRAGQRVAYIERQRPRVMLVVEGILWLFILLPVIIGAVSGQLALPFVSVMLLLVLLLFGGGMVFTVTPERITVHTGLLRVRWFALPLAQVAEARLHPYSPLKDFGGWGIRLGWGGILAFFYTGVCGVLLTTTRGRKYLLGSAHPERLLAVIEGVRG